VETGYRQVLANWFRRGRLHLWMGKSGNKADKGKRFFPSVRREDASVVDDGERPSFKSLVREDKKTKPRKRKASAVRGGEEACHEGGGGTKDELEARLQALMLKVEEFRAPEKKAARARVFRSIGKIRKSLQALENGDTPGSGANMRVHETDDNDQQDAARTQRPAKKQKKEHATANAAATPPAANKETRRKMKQRLQLLNKQIAVHGQRKQLTKARRVYEQIRSEGLTPSDYTYTNLINAFVRSGDIEGAMQLLTNMQVKLLE